MRHAIKITAQIVFWILCFLGFQPSVICQTSWSTELPSVGTFSSPRVVDLTRDGIGDIVLGAGREEFQSCDSAVIALDGATGVMLWKVSATDQIFGSATFLDITGDGVADVFIGGRSAELMAINGATGDLIWRFTEVHQLKRPAKKGWYNFYNVQLTHDLDKDGLADLCVSNGGDVMAEPYDPKRPAGSIVVICSANGRVLRRALMPDGKEIYMSITLSGIEEGLTSVVFGTGGETIGGNLFVASLDALYDEDLTTAIRLDSSETKGFIGPSVRADINDDGITDIFSNAVDGRLLAFDGDTYDKIWEVILPNTESYSSVAAGSFTEDDVPDFFLSFGRGVWPHLGWGIQQMIDGRTGEVLFTDSLGFYQNTSPLAVDITGDGLDEVVMSVNFQEIDEFYRKYFYNMLVYIDFATGDIQQISEIYPGNNLSSTPWVGDLDQDGKLDFIYCHGTNDRHTYTFDGMKVRRLTTEIPVPDKISWGAYQGSEYNGIYCKAKE